MKTPSNVSQLELECSCVNISARQWNILMENATKANKRAINKLVKKHIPDLYQYLSLHLRNPYNYYKTKNHLILVHSSIEYFIKYK